MSKTTIGFVGLGIMGRPMARNLLAAEYPVIAANRSPAAVDELMAAGAQRGASPRDVVERAEVVITMLPDTSDVESVYDGPDGLIAGSHPGQLLIDMSTIAPATTRALSSAAADRGVEMLDAPVSGGDVGARDGTLSIMVGGTQEGFDRAVPVLDVLGSTVVRMGGAGTGQLAKACNQIIVAITIDAVSEALVLGTRGGIDPARLLDVLGGGLAANRVMEVRRRNLLEHDFVPGFRARLHRKDLRIALAEAADVGVQLPGASAVTELFEALLSSGHGDDDHSSLLTVIEGLAGPS